MIRQDSSEIKHFFIREIRGEWMKLQLCIDYSSYFTHYVGEIGLESWEEISQRSATYPTYLDPMEAGDEATRRHSRTSTTSTPIIKSHIRLA